MLPTSFRPWQAARYGREPRVDGSGLVARRAERFWLIFSASAIIAAASPDLPRQIQANCPCRRVEILEDIIHIRRFSKDGAGHIDMAERGLRVGFAVRDDTVD